MKLRTFFALFILAFVAMLAVKGEFAAAILVATVGGAALTPVTAYQPHVFGAHTIDSALQLTEVLGSAMEALKRRLLVLQMIGAVYRNVALKGDDKMAVPFYPLTGTGTSQTRAANGSRKALATGTSTESRTIENWTNKMQAISFTAREKARQPVFDPVKHGQRKGEALAFDVIGDIFSIVKAKNFTGASIASTAGNFDENDVGDLRTACVTDLWPEGNRSLILSPAYGTNLLKQPQIIDASRRGDNGASFRDGKIGDVLGFGVGETPGLPSNNGTAFAITAATTDVISAVAHSLSDGDRVIFPTLTGGAGLTAASVAYFVRDKTADTFKVSATYGGAAVDITTAYTAGTCRLYEDVMGIACLDSAILIGFAPVPPTPAIRDQLFDYQELIDDSGLVIQYYHFADPDTDEEVQTMECHYGYGLGDAAQLKIIRSF